MTSRTLAVSSSSGANRAQGSRLPWMPRSGNVRQASSRDTRQSTPITSPLAAGGDVIGVDWRVSLDDAWRTFPDRGIQGNLDPCALFAPLDELTARVRDVIQRADGRPGHIFNLGHGILPETDPERARAVVDLV